MKAFYETRGGTLFVGPMTRYPFPLHVHEMLELAYVIHGDCVMQIGGENYLLKAGDLAINFPLVPHSFEQLSSDVSGFTAFFLADSISEFSNTFHTLMPVSPVLRADRIPQEVHYAIDRLMEHPGNEYFPTRLAYLHVLLAHVMDAMEFQPAEQMNEKGLADRVVKYIFDHACENITLSNAAHSLGISESHLSHLFSQQFRINFRRFVNAIRIDKAEALMRDPTMTLTAICYACGYENMRTFRRAFVRETGLLPTAYLQKLRDENALVTSFDA